MSAATAPRAAIRRPARLLALLAPTLGLVLVAVVGIAPPASAATSLDGPYAPGTMTSETRYGTWAEWHLTADNLCADGSWALYVSANGVSDRTSTPESGSGAVSSTIKGLIYAYPGSVAKLDVTIEFTGPSECFETVTISDTILVTPYVVPTTASLAYKSALPGFTGKLVATDGCQAERQVRLFKVDAGPDTKVDTATSADGGGFKLKGRAKKGTYYVKAPPDLRDDLTCGVAKSSNVRVG